VEGVTVTGRVPDMRPHLEDAAVFACPLRFGAGIQNKLLEAMALEVPVVSTSVAADGIRIGGASPPITIADDPATFAAALAERLRQPRAGAVPCADEREYVTRHFTWERAGTLLQATIDEAAREPDGTPTGGRTGEGGRT
jgi:glycosyltransferase involved in cell wall biosynthesis